MLFSSEKSVSIRNNDLCGDMFSPLAASLLLPARDEGKKC